MPTADSRAFYCLLFHAQNRGYHGKFILCIWEEFALCPLWVEGLLQVSKVKLFYVFRFSVSYLSFCPFALSHSDREELTHPGGTLICLFHPLALCVLFIWTSVLWWSKHILDCYLFGQFSLLSPVIFLILKSTFSKFNIYLHTSLISVCLIFGFLSYI